MRLSLKTRRSLALQNCRHPIGENQRNESRNHSRLIEDRRLSSPSLHQISRNLEDDNIDKNGFKTEREKATFS